MKKVDLTEEDLAKIAQVSLEMGVLLMECGASAKLVDEFVVKVARGLGAHWVDLRVGYASLSITVRQQHWEITRLRRVGPLGVNQRLYYGLRQLANRVAKEELSVVEVEEAIGRLVRETPKHPLWLMAVAAGLACAAFGRLLSVDWIGVGAVLIGSSLGQALRSWLHHRGFNVFLITVLVAFFAAASSGLLATEWGSSKVAAALLASVLLLVPGIPLFHAQHDILDGRPTLGTARLVWVTMILVFITVGLSVAELLLSVAWGRPIGG